jgi:hypothetical protein
VTALEIWKNLIVDFHSIRVEKAVKCNKARQGKATTVTLFTRVVGLVIMSYHTIPRDANQYTADVQYVAASYRIVSYRRDPCLSNNC